MFEGIRQRFRVVDEEVEEAMAADVSVYSSATDIPSDVWPRQVSYDGMAEDLATLEQHQINEYHTQGIPGMGRFVPMSQEESGERYEDRR